jgi:hypothetical protein
MGAGRKMPDSRFNIDSADGTRALFEWRPPVVLAFERHGRLRLVCLSSALGLSVTMKGKIRAGN